MTDTLDIFCRDSVDISRAYSELRKSVSGSGKDNPDANNDTDVNEDEAFNLPIEEIPDAMSPARDQVNIFFNVDVSKCLFGPFNFTNWKCLRKDQQ